MLQVIAVSRPTRNLLMRSGPFYGTFQTVHFQDKLYYALWKGNQKFLRRQTSAETVSACPALQGGLGAQVLTRLQLRMDTSSSDHEMTGQTIG